ncbi:MAG: NAD(P)-dependent alcohol dehydrogenase [Bacteroidetes bacterium]|jgi:NADPH:quinone reductase-like Zn-dependent oxidoreductase|nr:NAD(P)-dependent alcohol dehydrogenase [Bacteroidota bacterium]MDF1865801.1 NAD(P)-dependent alcohol dehydrogenase [Saprospiraceae bacterium]
MSTQKMRAIVTTKYGSPEVFQLTEFEKPTPQDNEVLVKVKAASVTAADTMMRKGSPYFGRLFIGLKKPKNPIPGTGFAGEIEALGKNVSLFQKGDPVFGEVLFSLGTNAEYVCVPEDALIMKKPNNITFEEAATICDGALTSMNFLKNLVNIQRGQKVLINGASGSLGTAAIQLAKYFGAEVTGVCSTANLEMVKSLGANKVIDYTKEDFTKSDETYDIIYDTVGKSSFAKSKSALASNGVYLSPVLSLSLFFQMIVTSIFGNKKAKFDATGVRPIPELRKMLQDIKEIIKEGNLKTVIDRVYPLEKIKEAHQYIDMGHKKGNVVVTMV